MKTVWKKVSDILAIIVTVFALCVMMLTILSITTVGRQSKSVLGFSLYVVTSDSMKATDFSAVSAGKGTGKGRGFQREK